jgi:hypothetical protein
MEIQTFVSQQRHVIIAIGGVMACGKTSLMQNLIRVLIEKGYKCSDFTAGEIAGNIFPYPKIAILGNYNVASKFGGAPSLPPPPPRRVHRGGRGRGGKGGTTATRLVRRKALTWALQFLAKKQYNCYLFEDDALFNQSAFEWMLKHDFDLRLIVLNISYEQQIKRFAVGGRNTAPLVLHRSEGKIYNLYNRYQADIWVNETIKDAARNVARLVELVESVIKPCLKPKKLD